MSTISSTIKHWTVRAELPAGRLLGWLGLGTSKFHAWKGRYGVANEHNGQVPRDGWLEAWEQQAILDYHDSHPLNGSRRLARRDSILFKSCNSFIAWTYR